MTKGFGAKLTPEQGCVVVACCLRRRYIGLVLRFIGREAVAADVLPRPGHAGIRGRGEPGPDAIARAERRVSSGDLADFFDVHGPWRRGHGGRT